MAELSNLITKRTVIKTRLTKFKTYLEKIENSQLSNRQLIELECRITNINSILNEYNEIQINIEILQAQTQAKEVTATTSSTDDSDNFEDKYFENVALAKEILSKNQPVVSLQHVTQPAEISSVTNIQKPGVKLPTISLPTFNGNYETWLEFHDSFVSMIHSNKEISNIEKFHYLRDSVSGDAEQVIKSLNLSESNYQVAWDSLCERYNNSKLIIHNHVKGLFELPPIKCESFAELRTMVDTVTKHIRSLKNLNEATDQWDTLLIYMIERKVDSVTLRRWEEFKSTLLLPATYNNMITFLKNRADLLETLNVNSESQFKLNKAHKGDQKSAKSSQHSFPVKNESKMCNFCKGNHFIYRCADFLKLPVNARINHVKSLNLCLNCLRNNHFSKDCRSGGCTQCKRKHNTLLHYDTRSEPTAEQDLNPSQQPQTSASNASSQICNATLQTPNILLSTALVKLKNPQGRTSICRVLLDSGSQPSLITEKCCKQLGLSMNSVNVSVIGVGERECNVTQSCKVTVCSLKTNFEIKLDCLVVPKIMEQIPNSRFDISTLNIPKNVQLSDPNFNKPGQIDLLIGSSIFWDLLCIGQIKTGHGNPTLQKTKFGWIVAGPLSISNNINSNSRQHCNLTKTIHIQEQLSKFWELEDIPDVKILSREQKLCEDHFLSTFGRDTSGRFVVSLPLKQDKQQLGNSKERAIQRFYSLERKLQLNSRLNDLYSEFMREYSDLGHMTKVNEPNESTVAYYLPHHGVLKESSLTTKLRVVFDGSAPSDSGVSVNNLQMVGPTIQDDLFSILIRFRQHAIAITADIEKMYRQVLMNETDRSLQQIIWRQNPSDPLEVYQLNTVTYGMAAAPFLAIRCLYQLGVECEGEFPEISALIKGDFYVDDLLTGSDSVQAAQEIVNNITTVLSKGCFRLRKWVSNEPEALKDLPAADKISNNVSLNLESNTKTLGLNWNPISDYLFFTLGVELGTHVSKRTVLSSIAQIYDPLGLIGPCTIIGKLIMQNLWLLKLTWDESLPVELFCKWRQFMASLSNLNNIKVPRHISSITKVQVELHGFSDASQSAYGACIFLRTTDQSGRTKTTLICSKGKVAPLKLITIPKLELCGAVVLSRLVHQVKNALSLSIHNTFLWTDSTIVLGWIKTSPHLLKTFVANRVATVQSLTETSVWGHVASKDNPADLISRGLYPTELQNNSLWWNGPLWLSLQHAEWPTERSSVNQSDLPELKNKQTCCKIEITDNPVVTIKDFSCLTNLKRALAYCLRYIQNLRLPSIERVKRNYLTTNELRKSYLLLIKISQAESFAKEINQLSEGKELSSKNAITSLKPFLDSEGIIRVGGRLTNSEFNYNKKHPFLIHGHHPLAKLLMRYEHLRLLHAGVQLTLSSLRDSIWLTHGKNLAKRIVRECKVCHRFNATTPTQLMGDLPADRVRAMPAFYVTGVDYAGPFILKDRKGRGCKTFKSYIALFVCFSTRAIHLELVTELTSEAFIAAFRRFVARRGKPTRMYSDNGTNFVGANNALTELANFFGRFGDHISEKISNDHVDWHFIPSHAPHFGGLWEAGVKSTKHHLKRVLSNTILTFEDFYTVLTQIECVLNSRPLTPLSTDPTDYEALTPGHFLIGRPLTMLPDPNVLEIKESRLSRFQYLQRLHQDFWKRWNKEYISQLQQRVKWKNTQRMVKIGTLVLIKEDNAPPANWKLGRVIELHLGKDNLPRVVSIQTSSGVVKRALCKISPLPIDDCNP